MSNFDYTGYLRNNLLLKEVDEPEFESPEEIVSSNGLGVGDIVVLTREVDTIVSHFPEGEEMEIISGHKNLPGYHLMSTRDGGQVWGLEPDKDFRVLEDNGTELNEEENTYTEEEIFREWSDGERDAGNLEAYVKSPDQLEGDSKTTWQTYFKALNRFPDWDHEDVALAVSDILYDVSGGEFDSINYERMDANDYKILKNFIEGDEDGEDNNEDE